MRQTLFTIPYEIGGVRIFGFGALLAVWTAVSVVLLAVIIRRHGLNRNTLGYLPVFALVGALIAFAPRAFDGGFPIRGYGLMMLLGVVSGVWMLVYRARRMGLDPEQMLSLSFWMFIAGILGARAFFVIEYWQSFDKGDWAQTLLAIANISEGGLVVYGSFITASIAAVIYLRRQGLPILAVADLAAPSMLLGLAFGRIGCLLNGCCFGGECELPWRVTFPWGSPPHQRQVEEGRIDVHGIWFAGGDDDPPVVESIEPGSAAERAELRPGDRITRIDGVVIEYDAAGEPREKRLSFRATEDEPLTVADVRSALLRIHGEGSRTTISVAGSRRTLSLLPDLPPPRSRPVHPTQIYSAITAALLTLFMLAYYPFRRRDGEVFALLGTLYPIARFCLEIIRTDEHAVFGTGLSISQNVSLLLFLVTAILWAFILRQPRGSALPMQSFSA